MIENANIPDLQRLRDWYLDKVILRDFEGANAVSSLGKKMLGGTVQEYLPISDRDPSFRNLDFCLSHEQFQQMLMDETSAKQVRQPSFDQINAWMKVPGMLDMRYRRISNYLTNLASGAILLSRLELVAMKAAQSFVSSSINQPNQAVRN
jgi:hypothetical protein